MGSDAKGALTSSAGSGVVSAAIDAANVAATAAQTGDVKRTRSNASTTNTYSQLPKLGPVTSDGQLSELLPEMSRAAGGGSSEEPVGVTGSTSQRSQKKGMLRPLPPLAAPLSQAQQAAAGDGRVKE